MSAPPAFQFYADDFLSGCLHMAPEEVGVYIRLLCWQWSKGCVPADDSALERITGAAVEVVRRVLREHFCRRRNGWKNRRLEEVRRSQVELSKARRAAGRKGGQASGQTRSKTQAAAEAKQEANAKQSATLRSPSPSSRRIEFEIDHVDISLATSLESEIAKKMKPRNAGDRVLAWRAAWLVASGVYSEHWLHDSIAAARAGPRKANIWGYFLSCLRNAATSAGRDFGADCELVPGKRLGASRSPPGLPRAILKKA